ncbi:3-deoxy-7-phosphoheptulonate synthase [Hathewaya histolytica]|uniref:Phospho-2-dehydro-3-deoxyheptonate aldolase n=1 Tax=Hathewaya histolytica TaxID=1498 RepID=A0A4U9R079_HATHI|nr:3-deoxy-7-phosphoheptulonate synthase [Hathewaya histolytica]VTQ84416.1 phospho-2-dehydro-3-deoxyheptonate aldolase [Hathewaya histolytica]
MRYEKYEGHKDTEISIGNSKIGGGNIALIAGPCSVESREQIVSIARDVKKSGAKFLRGGAFKPRTSPYSFQGLGCDGLSLLLEAKKETGLPIVTEIMSTEYLDLFEEKVDVIQVGARNMQNFELLKALGKTRKPILLKRGASATIEEFLMASEYILAGGNENVVLCERGIRTFENFTRNTLDLSAVVALKSLTHLPVVVDPSHGSGLWWMVEPLAKAAVVVGADGLIIEVHNNPEKALCDGNQSLKPKKFNALVNDLREFARIQNKNI